MRKIILAGLIAATLTPIGAQAQVVDHRERHELQNDRRDIRDEHRDVRDARRSGDPRQIRDERGDLRNARQEYRQDSRDARRPDNRDWRRDDWRSYRNQNRAIYRGYGWQAPFRYQAFRPGIRIGGAYYGPRYVIADPWRYRLPRPGFNQQWVRHYNDVLLVDVRRGIVLDVIHNFYW